MWRQEGRWGWQDGELWVRAPDRSGKVKHTVWSSIKTNRSLQRRGRDWLTCSWPSVSQALAWRPHTWASTTNSTCGAFERKNQGHGPWVKKGRERKLRSRPHVSAQVGSTAIHCPCAISSDPGPPDGQRQVSFVHSQVEMGNLHGLEKRYRKRSAFEDHPQLFWQFLTCRDHTGESCPVLTVGLRRRQLPP